jgi:hypothetical protein
VGRPPTRQVCFKLEYFKSKGSLARRSDAIPKQDTHKSDQCVVQKNARLVQKMQGVIQSAIAWPCSSNLRRETLLAPQGLAVPQQRGCVTGSHGKLHRTPKILSHAWRRGSRVAARGDLLKEGAENIPPQTGSFFYAMSATTSFEGKIKGVSLAAKLRRGSTRTCSAARSRCAHWQCVCVPSPAHEAVTANAAMRRDHLRRPIFAYP